MAPSDSQQPEIGVREEEEEVGKTKQNKHRGNFKLPGLGLDRQATKGEMVQGRATEEGELKKGNRE